jgi:hypothetical protein
MFRRKLIAFFTFIGGAYFFLEFLLPEQVAGFTPGKYHEQILRGVQVVGIMAIGLGIISILRVHGSRVIRQGSFNSAALLLGFFLTLYFQSLSIIQDLEVTRVRKTVAGYADFVRLVQSEIPERNPLPRIQALRGNLQALESEYPSELFATTIYPELALLEQSPEAPSEALTAGISRLAVEISLELKSRYQSSTAKLGEGLINRGLFIPLGAAMFSLLAFYIASAAFRSFRVRSVESSVLMLTAVIVMLGQIPQGSMYISESLPEIRLWILKNVSTPAFRAIFFGSAVAGLAMAIRIWLSLERGPFDEERK